MSFFTDPPLHDFPDRAIRKLLANPANLRELVEAVDPVLAAQLDFAAATLVDRSFPLDDWRHRESDLFFEIPLLEGDSDRTVLVCVLVEHQSADDPWMPLRMLVYACLYWERKWKEWQQAAPPRPAPRLAPVVPILFHTGNRPWKSPRRMSDLLEGPDSVAVYAPEWRVLLWDLAERSAEELQAAAGAWMRALAVVRAQSSDGGTFRSVYTDVIRKLDELVEREEVRRDDLLWFLLSWALQRRPEREGEELLARAIEIQTAEGRRRELEEMSQTIERSWIDARVEERLATIERSWIDARVEERLATIERSWIDARVEERLKERLEKANEITTATATAEAIVRVLRTRHGALPPDTEAAVRSIGDAGRLGLLLEAASLCRTLEEFQSKLSQ